MQITLPFFAFVSLNVMPYVHPSGKENIEIPSGYAIDTNETNQIWITDDKDQSEAYVNEQ